MKARTPVLQLLAIAALLATIVLSGCADISGGVRCIPPPMTLTPRAATAGATVTLSADGAKCQAGSGRHYQVTIRGVLEQRRLGEVTPASDGSFQFPFAIPGDLPAGSYEVVVSGSALDDCTPAPNESCAQYSTVLTIEDTTTGQQ